MEKNTAITKGKRNIPNLKSRSIIISIKTIYSIKYNFLKSNLL
ncbi:hypothetical protein HMPREF0554_2250 [Pseudoleptotrichia goodfellowii F0264]|uniref:Uncharacterized protein n=1 Tax=Pseudoleptotrichia goodfellowii F0264 TaxID=596323 RepID=D0GP08_9FUSO|nr:hypothetical protein HMPREF0554_2250 [Pseudoleptotrichia goodfellowii F0264]